MRSVVLTAYVRDSKGRYPPGAVLSLSSEDAERLVRLGRAEYAPEDASTSPPEKIPDEKPQRPKGVHRMRKEQLIKTAHDLGISASDDDPRDGLISRILEATSEA